MSEPGLPDKVHEVISKHERWTFRSVASSPHDDEFIADLARAITVPEGMTPEKLEKIAAYVSLLDRLDVDLDAETVTFHKAGEGPHAGETEMQDDLRAWARHLQGES
jgi:hypothetical protein